MAKSSKSPFIFGGVFGAALVAVVGFATGWVVTGGRAEVTAREMSAQAVTDQLVPICLHQFQGEADGAGKLQSLRDLSKWDREGYVRDQGWATMPGSDSPVAGVARACAEQLTKAAS